MGGTGCGGQDRALVQFIYHWKNDEDAYKERENIQTTYSFSTIYFAYPVYISPGDHRSFFPS
jgi:hypothetical protein